MLVELKYLEVGTDRPSIYLPWIVANRYSIQTIGSQTSHNNNRKPQRVLEYKKLAFQFYPFVLSNFVITSGKLTWLLCASLLSSTQFDLPPKMLWDVKPQNATCFHPLLASPHRAGWMSEYTAQKTLDNKHKFKSWLQHRPSNWATDLSFTLLINKNRPKYINPCGLT